VNPLDVPKTQARAIAGASRSGLTPLPGGQKRPRERLLASMIETVGERGYAATTVANVIAHAGASRRTFYQQFTDRQACFLAASDQISGVWIERAGRAVDSAAETGQDAVEAFIGALFHAALATPAAPRLLVAELAAAGRPGIERRERVFTELAATLRRALAAGTTGKPHTGASHKPTETSLVLRALVGAIARVPYSRTLRGHSVRRPRPGTLLDLVPQLAQWAATYRSVSPPALASSVGPPHPGAARPGRCRSPPVAVRAADCRVVRAPSRVAS
jgi:AcrR family transcriptional regulator